MSEVIVITSGKGGVGKTTTAANIGIGLAQLGKKVVMVDTDIGLRNLDVVLGLENRIVYNLVDVVEGNCRMKQALIRDKRYPDLFLLPSAQTRDKSSVSPGQMIKLVEDLRANFLAECTEVGMYLAMSRQADREGYPEVAEAYKRIAFEEAEHAAKFAELLGEVVTADTKENLRLRVDAEYGATDGKLKLAKKAKELGLDAIHDTVHEMCKDEARHGKAFLGLLERYFG